MAEMRPETAGNQTDDQKLATEALYKQNAELAVRNKTLSLLRTLYQISILALEPEPLAEKIVAAVREGLDLELVGILHLDAEADALVPLKFSLSERLVKSELAAGIELEAIAISPLRSRPLLAGAVAKITPAPSIQISDIWDGSVPAAAITALTEDGHIKNLSAYPLVINNRATGMILFGLNRTYDTLSQFERDSLDNVATVTAVALDRAQLYQALRLANVDLAKANDGQKQFIHYLNHESKGYLTDDNVVLSAVKEGEFGPMPPELAKMATTVLRKNKRAADDIDEMILGADLGSGAVRYTMEPFDLKEAASFIDEYRPDGEEKGQKLEFQSEDGDFTMVGDKRRLLRHALKNYLRNAIVYTPAGGIIVVGLAHVKGTQSDERVVLSVKDSGVGISAEDKTRLFTEGGKGLHSTDVNPNSTGRGLYIVKQIAEAHGGRVWAESAGAGKGSTFFLEIPVKQQ